MDDPVNSEKKRPRCPQVVDPVARPLLSQKIKWLLDWLDVVKDLNQNSNVEFMCAYRVRGASYQFESC